MIIEPSLVVVSVRSVLKVIVSVLGVETVTVPSLVKVMVTGSLVGVLVSVAASEVASLVSLVISLVTLEIMLETSDSMEVGIKVRREVSVRT